MSAHSTHPEAQPGEITGTELAAELGVDIHAVARAISALEDVNDVPEDDIHMDGTTLFLGEDGAARVRTWLAKNSGAAPALERVRQAHLAYLQAGIDRAAVVEEVRNVPGVTMVALASEMQMTRDGVYKMLAAHCYR